MGKLRVLVTNAELQQEAIEMLKERYVYALASYFNI
jgi:hypothetical protein